MFGSAMLACGYWKKSGYPWGSLHDIFPLEYAKYMTKKSVFSLPPGGL